MKKWLCFSIVPFLLFSCGEQNEKATADSAAVKNAADSAVSHPGETNYTDAGGKRHGHWVITGRMDSGRGYPPEGKIEEGDYRDDLREGLWTEYATDGTVSGKGLYVNGKKSGKWGVYDKNGQETGEIIYP